MPGNPLTDQNWAHEVTDQITTFVGTVRDKTTNNAIKAVRAVVYGLLIVLVGTLLVIALIVGLTRALQALLSLFGLSWSRSVYVSYLIIGGIFVGAGVLAMKKRHPNV